MVGVVSFLLLNFFALLGIIHPMFLRLFHPFVADRRATARTTVTIDLFEKDSFLFVKRALPFCFCNVLAGFSKAKAIGFWQNNLFVYERTFKPKLGLRCFVCEFVYKCKCFDVI